MAPHQQRVVDEKKELDDKLSKLSAFLKTSIYSSLPTDEQDRLSRQCEIMGRYSDILNDRIIAFPV